MYLNNPQFSWMDRMKAGAARASDAATRGGQSANWGQAAQSALDVYQSMQQPKIAFQNQPMSPEQRALYQQAMGFVNNSPTREALNPIIAAKLAQYGNTQWMSPRERALGQSQPATSPAAGIDMNALYAALAKNQGTAVQANGLPSGEPIYDKPVKPRGTKSGGGQRKARFMGAIKGAIGGAGGGGAGAGLGAITGAMSVSEQQKARRSEEMAVYKQALALYEAQQKRLKAMGRP